MLDVELVVDSDWRMYSPTPPWLSSSETEAGRVDSLRWEEERVLDRLVTMFLVDLRAFARRVDILFCG